jgi:hypothetical protein
MTSIYLQNSLNEFDIQNWECLEKYYSGEKTANQNADSILISRRVKLAIILMKIATLHITLILQSQYANSVVLSFFLFGRTQNY